MARQLRLTSPPIQGSDVRRHQHHVNLRLAAVSLVGVQEDGEYGGATAKATQRAKYVLGFPLKAVSYDGASPTAQLFIRKPQVRPVTYRVRESWRRKHEWAVVRLWRKRQREAAKKRKGPAGAVREARKHVGSREAGSSNWDNGGIVSTCLRFFGLGPAPWCGAFAGYCVNKAGGKLTRRVVYVPYIAADARAGRNGFSGYHSDPQPGDLAVIKGQYHVELYVGNGLTIGGNTSPGSGGSQGNGGGCYVRNRGVGAFEGFARPRW